MYNQPTPAWKQTTTETTTETATAINVIAETGPEVSPEVTLTSVDNTDKPDCCKKKTPEDNNQATIDKTETNSSTNRSSTSSSSSSSSSTTVDNPTSRISPVLNQAKNQLLNIMQQLNSLLKQYWQNLKNTAPKTLLVSSTVVGGSLGVAVLTVNSQYLAKTAIDLISIIQSAPFFTTIGQFASCLAHCLQQFSTVAVNLSNVLGQVMLGMSATTANFAQGVLGQQLTTLIGTVTATLSLAAVSVAATPVAMIAADGVKHAAKGLADVAVDAKNSASQGVRNMYTSLRDRVCSNDTQAKEQDQIETTLSFTASR